MPVKSTDKNASHRSLRHQWLWTQVKVTHLAIADHVFIRGGTATVAEVLQEGLVNFAWYQGLSAWPDRAAYLHVQIHVGEPAIATLYDGPQDGLFDFNHCVIF